MKQEKKDNRVLLVIPAYNEAENLPYVIGDILKQEDRPDYIVVSDGSSDGTVELCRERGYDYIELPVNLGLAGCFQAGMKYAWRNGYQYAVQFDGDGQHRAEDVRILREKMEEGGYDLVLGSRFLERQKGGSMREIGSRLLTAAIRLTTGQVITDPTCGLRMYSRDTIGRFANQLNYGPEPDTISWLLKKGLRVAEAPVRINERIAGESYLRPWKAAMYMVRMLTSILIIQNYR